LFASTAAVTATAYQVSGYNRRLLVASY